MPTHRKDVLRHIRDILRNNRDTTVRVAAGRWAGRGEPHLSLADGERRLTEVYSFISHAGHIYLELDNGERFLVTVHPMVTEEGSIHHYLGAPSYPLQLPEEVT